ncbi:glycosyltransferase [Sphingobium soli]|uniref:Glycosyltransferase n=1 Tax=Sphingobium soli TaxID=1591116 RepID=A0ABS8H891_9SPHN|nr:glycosyltransferase family 2 protein [Sphingobium soli]MCC4234760.1 glycosyltransferase [Sphingobium soli]
MSDISLLVCTRNRAAALSNLLRSVSVAIDHAAGTDIDVVIVDNGSTDDTPTMLARWARCQPFSVHLVEEPQAGLARARNTGLRHCRGRVIAMTDDDCVLHADYFDALACCFARLGKDVIVGGRILLGNPLDLPVTIKIEDHPMILHPEAFPGGFVMGANLALTATVVDRVGFFDDRFGSGACFQAAEDTDYLFRAAGLGCDIRYDPSFAVDHHHGRRRGSEEKALLASYSFGDGALYAKHCLSDRRIWRAIGDDVRLLSRDLFAPVRQHEGVRYFYAFRLRHKLRGVLAFAKSRCCRRRSLVRVG